MLPAPPPPITTKIPTKCSCFSIDCTFFLWEGQGHFGDKDQISLWSEIQTLSHILLVRQTSNHHHCDQHAQNLYARTFKWFRAVHPGQKSLVCVFLRNKYDSQIRNAMEKYEILQTGSVIAHGIQKF